MTSELKPCPFCGGKARLYGGPMAQETYAVRCEKGHMLEGGFDEAAMITAWNTRAAPDVPELVTVAYDADESGRNVALVSRTQAAAVIAAKDVLLAIAKQWARDQEERAEAAEAELAQSERQEPVTHYIVSEFGAEFDKVKMMPIGRHPLYTAPVASDADLRAENDKLRQAAKPFAEYGLDYFDKDNTGSPLPDEQGVGWIYLNYGHFRALRTALQEKGERG